mmetsp:Transcript_48317/g.138137  ORF Transcript_48317/g.138137 Transcript_48317/m.138137 type:complete len:265 (-) Transcript_48317:907-1701(-)
MSCVALAMSVSSALMVDASSAILASRSALRSSVFSVVISFSLNSALHQSCFLTSSSVCFFSITIMSSIAFLTFAKASSSTVFASIDSSGLCVFAATSRSARAASRRRCCTSELSAAALRAEPRCSRLYVPAAASLASSSVRIPIVSVTATISAWRAALRSSQFLSASAHVTFTFFRKASLFARMACSWPRSSLASASSFAVLASSSSFCSSIFSPASISAVLALRRIWNSSERMDSCFCDSPRSASISSLSCFRMPTISPLWAV